MEDLAASLTPYPHSAPLYLLYDATSIANASRGLAPPPPLLGDDDDGFEFATTTTTTLLNGGGLRGRAVPAEPAAAAAAAARALGGSLGRDVAHAVGRGAAGRMQEAQGLRPVRGGAGEGAQGRRRAAREVALSAAAAAAWRRSTNGQQRVARRGEEGEEGRPRYQAPAVQGLDGQHRCGAQGPVAA